MKTALIALVLGCVTLALVQAHDSRNVAIENDFRIALTFAHFIETGRCGQGNRRDFGDTTIADMINVPKNRKPLCAFPLLQ